MKNKQKKTLFAQLLEEAGLSMSKFSSITGTPYRTVQDWKDGKRRTPRIAITFLKLYKKLQDYSLILCPFCDCSFMIENERLQEDNYSFRCPSCGGTSEEAKEMIDEFIIQPAEWIA